MKVLAPTDCTAWLAGHEIPEEPYGRVEMSAQFPISKTQSSSWVAEALVETFEPFESALLQFTDWSLYNPSEMAVVMALRAAHGEADMLIKSPGHLFSFAERDLLAGMFALAMSYSWSAYVYFDHGGILHCWEGDLLDVWTQEAEKLESVQWIFAKTSTVDTPDKPSKIPL